MVTCRAAFSSDVLDSLVDRCAWGAGLDSSVRVNTGGRRVSAKTAEGMPLSKSMLLFVKKVCDFLYGAGATHVTVHRDPRRPGSVGAVQVLWVGDVKVAEVAERFKVSVTADGLPCIPSWLSLRAEHDFDLRWQPFSLGETWV